MKPSIPSGTRDFGPLQAAKRKYIFNTLENVFKLHGFQPIETPAMENLQTLNGKYGDEGDQLIFKILNSGDFMSKVPPATLIEVEEPNSKLITPYISERALRYDLTVPFARFVTMNRNDISFPFKRYQIQPVWRADRPQKGRYREFYQCDVDIIGSDSLMNEVELIQLYVEAFEKLGTTNYELRINNRKLLQGIAEQIGAADKFIELSIAIDKLDKIGWDGVVNELTNRGWDSHKITELKSLFLINGSFEEILSQLKSKLTSEIAKKGIAELETINSRLQTQDSKLTPINYKLDLALARGLSYYTGCIFEVVVNDPACTFKGSISGGGRYDDLTGIFGMPGVSGVGISFGADRIYDVMEELNLFPEGLDMSSKVLVCCIDEESLQTGLSLCSELRRKDIPCELYPSASKIKKQLDYANAKHIPFVVIIGDDERKSGIFSIKNMETGEQQKLKIEELFSCLTLNSK
ncbi:MAG: histidine--tRNA ligase [Flavobacteriaceae bacterium]|nr:histidine--tRNA ligase [Flavobacteriaceae bacterium]